MIKNFTYGLLFAFFLLGFNSCKDEEVSPPPKTSFTVNQTTGDANETEFVFTVDQVNANSISLLPYGTENLSLGGVLVTNFAPDGKATVKFKYLIVGTFNAVVVTNNHSGDGELINTYSDPISITIGSNRTELKDFSFEKSTKTEQTGTSITVTVPFGTDVTKLKPKFTSSAFSTVTAGGVEVKSGATEVNFTSPQMLTVTSNRGPAENYSVTVNVTPVETDNSIKSITGKEVSKSTKDKVAPADVNNVDKRIVIYDVFGTPSTTFDSVRLNYALNGKFALVKYNGKKLKQDSLLNLTSSKQIVVFGQDSVTATYDVYAVAAPKLELAFNGLVPPVTGVTDNFTIKLTVLKNTTVASLIPDATITAPAGVVVTMSTVSNNVATPFISGVTPVNFSSPVTFQLTVTDPALGFSYKVNYVVSVVVVP